MKAIANLSVGARLGAGFGLVLVLMIALTGVAISRMSFIQRNLDEIVKVDSAKIRLVNEMRDVVRYTVCNHPRRRDAGGFLHQENGNEADEAGRCDLPRGSR